MPALNQRLWEDLQPEWWRVGSTWQGIFLRPAPFQPNVRVSIGGVEVTELLDTDVIVRSGRDTIYQPTNAGYASFDFVALQSVPLAVGDAVVITVDNFVGGQFPVFTGKVSDFQRRLTIFSPVEPEVVVSVQAVGPLADVARRVVLFDGRPEELDGERVLALLQDAVPDAVDPALIDEGLFTLAPLPAADGGYDPLRVIQDSAFSSQGVLFETPNGRIGYADGDRRFITLRTNVVDIPLDVTTVDRFVVFSQLADLVNEVVVEYGDDDVVTASNEDSVALFGPFDRSLRTVLANQANAESFAEEFLERQAFPSLQIREIGVSLDVVDPFLLEKLYTLGSCGCSDAIRVRGIPNRLGITQFEGFVEGIEWRLSRTSGEMRLLVSEADLSVGSDRWTTLDPALIWDDVDPVLIWDDARRVTDGGS
jgi:hypothetical protein